VGFEPGSQNISFALEHMVDVNNMCRNDSSLCQAKDNTWCCCPNQQKVKLVLGGIP
jgi:hypothetical protein